MTKRPSSRSIVVAEEVLNKALAKARAWDRRPSVLGTAIGQRHRKEQYLAHATGDLCIVVTVREKLKDNEMRARRVRPFPSDIEVEHHGRKYRIPVDVQHSAGQSAVRLRGVVALPLDFNGSPMGAVAAIVSSGSQRFLLTAGHVAQATGTRLQVRGGSAGTATTVRMNNRLDCALVELDDPPTFADESFSNGDRLAGVRSIAPALVGKSCFFRTAATGEIESRTVRNVSASAPVPLPNAAAPTPMSGLVATDGPTSPGDSGTILYDSSFLAVGTLVGDLGHLSYFVPCDYSLLKLNVEIP
jgi:hypothetical protein